MSPMMDEGVFRVIVQLNLGTKNTSTFTAMMVMVARETECSG